MKSSDGAVLPIGFYDSTLQENCAFTGTSDGKTRCIPSGVPVGTNGYFSDAACQNPLFFAATGACVTSGYALYYDTAASTNACVTNSAVRIFNLGAKLSPPPTSINAINHTTGQCVSVDATLLTQSGDFYVTTEIDPSNFVEGSDEVL
jgi:hypothetical protein